MKRYAQYKHSGMEWIGEIPEEWEVKKIADIYQERNTKVSDTEFEALSVTKNGIFPQLETVAKTDNGDSRKLVRRNDFVINSRSDRRGSCGISPFDGSVSLINIVIFPKLHINNTYFGFLFRSHHFADEFYRWGKGIVDDLWSTKWSSMRNICIPVPSIETQNIIADYLDLKTAAIDSLINDKQKLIDLLKEKQQIIISKAVTKGLNKSVKVKDSGIEWIGEIPSHWHLKRLRYLGYCQNGLSKAGEFFGSGYPFVSYGDVYKNIELPQTVEGLVESTDTERDNCSVQRGDVFFTRTSETIEEVALTATCLETIDNATFAGFLIRFRPYTQYNIIPEFSKYYFRSQLHRAYFVKEMNLVTRASLSQELLKNLSVLLPPIEEQKEIGEYLDHKTAAIDSVITDIIEQIERLKEYRQSLISEAVTGKVAI